MCTLKNFTFILRHFSNMLSLLPLINSLEVKWQFGLRIWEEWEEIGKMCTCAQSHMPFIAKWQTAMYCGDMWCPMPVTLSYFHIISEGALWPSNASNTVTLSLMWDKWVDKDFRLPLILKCDADSWTIWDLWNVRDAVLLRIKCSLYVRICHFYCHVCCVHQGEKTFLTWLFF